MPLSPTCETLFAETRRVLVNAIALPAGSATLAAWTERLTAGSLVASASALAWSGSAATLPPLLPLSLPPQAISTSGEASARLPGRPSISLRRRGSGPGSESGA